MVESNKHSGAKAVPASQARMERSPAETAETMKRLYKMPYEIVKNSSEDAAASESNSMFKVIIIGDSGVGKSCLMHRVTTNEFIQDHEVTVGVEFGSLVIRLE